MDIISQFNRQIEANQKLLRGPQYYARMKVLLAQARRDEMGLMFKEVSPEELQQIKSEIRQTVRAEKIRHTMFVFALTLVATALMASGAYAFANALLKEPSDLAIHDETEQAQAAENKAKFGFYMMDGNRWLREKNTYNAQYQARLAVKLQPGSYEANLLLSKALLLDCMLNQENCAESSRQSRWMRSIFAHRGFDRDIEKELTKLDFVRFSHGLPNLQKIPER